MRCPLYTWFQARAKPTLDQKVRWTTLRFGPLSYLKLHFVSIQETVPHIPWAESSMSPWRAGDHFFNSPPLEGSGSQWPKEDLEIGKAEGKQQPSLLGAVTAKVRPDGSRGACGSSSSLVSSAPCPVRLPEGCLAGQQCSSLTRQQSQRPPCELPKVLLG